MPELPEVETIRRGLDRLIISKKIVRVDVLSEKSFVGEVGRVIGRVVVDVSRRGKALIVVLDGGMNLMMHLRMTGQIIFAGREFFAAGHPNEEMLKLEPGRHTRIVVEFGDGSKLFFNDQRKFGFVKVMNDEELLGDVFLRKLGPEPWDMNRGEFFKRLQRRRGTTIKAAILDQSVIAGVGNIYADEGLYRAGIFPGRKVGEISLEEAIKLLAEICGVMEKSIESGGSTMRDYRKADGSKGDYLEKFAEVFGRDGEECRKCGGEILKTRVAGRGTHYCENCQK